MHCYFLMGTLTEQLYWNGSWTVCSAPEHVQHISNPLLRNESNICIDSLSGDLGEFITLAHKFV